MPVQHDHRPSEAVAFLRFLAGVPGFVRQRMSYDEACEVIRARLRSRETNFLTMLQRSVFGYSASPYKAMLESAGCTLGDVERSVRTHGLEETLRQLRAAGVGVSFEEFKGYQPIVRGGREIPAGPAAFDSPRTQGHLGTQSGGTTGAPRRARLDLAKLRFGVPHAVILSHLDGGPEVPRVRWSDIPPAAGLSLALRAGAVGEAPAIWYSAVWPGHGVPARFLWATRAAVLAARLGGARVPMPRHLRLEQADTVAHLAGRLLEAHGRCVLRSSVSRMALVAGAARASGIDLTGATLMGGGEPPTEAKVAMIRASGARFTSSYQMSEIGMAGILCRDTDDPNDQHLMMDHLALIQGSRRVPGFDVDVPAFCFTSLDPDAPKVLLNAESDDYGVVTTRPCGCPWGALGLTTHLSGIRSFRKLTSGGVTLIGTDIERILGKDLPAVHGGSPLDYQLLEEEDERGVTRVILLVNPDLPAIDDLAVAQTFLAAIKAMRTRAGFAHALWLDGHVLRVRRERPRWTTRGKLLPLQLDQRTRTSV